MSRGGRWVRQGPGRGGKVPEHEKAAITNACEKFIAEVLKPRFLPEIVPTGFNYPIDILGKWHGNKYRFVQRYRSGFPENLNDEFDAPFTRLEYRARDRFALSYMRHTEKWFCLYYSLTLAQALDAIENEIHFQPIS